MMILVFVEFFKKKPSSSHYKILPVAHVSQSFQLLLVAFLFHLQFVLHSRFSLVSHQFFVPQAIASKRKLLPVGTVPTGSTHQPVLNLLKLIKLPFVRWRSDGSCVKNICLLPTQHVTRPQNHSLLLFFDATTVYEKTCKCETASETLLKLQPSLRRSQQSAISHLE